MSVRFSQPLLALAVAAALGASGAALAAGSHKGGHSDGDADGMAFGQPGEASKADRTIEIVMADNYFELESLVIEAGETVRFVLKNEGEFLHEFNLGTAAMHAAHQEEMMTMMEHGMLTATGVNQEMMKMDHSSMGMSGHAHNDPNSVLVEPGNTQELVWTFAETTDLEFACNVPGHYDAGMMGEIKFVAPGKAGS